MSVRLNALLRKGSPERQHGYILAAGVLLLVLIGLGMNQIWGTWNQAQQKQSAVNVQRDLNAVRQGVEEMWAAQTSYSTNAASMEQVLADSNAVPKGMIDGQELTHAFDAGIEVRSVNGGRQFEVQFNAIPADACVKLMTQDWGTSTTQMTSDPGGGNFANNDLPPTPSQAQQACGTQPQDVTWRFR